MVTVNRNYLKLPGSYLFSTIAGKCPLFKRKIRKPESFALELEM